jgi:hypothetical protein
LKVESEKEMFEEYKKCNLCYFLVKMDTLVMLTKGSIYSYKEDPSSLRNNVRQSEAEPMTEKKAKS